MPSRLDEIRHRLVVARAPHAVGRDQAFWWRVANDATYLLELLDKLKPHLGPAVEACKCREHTHNIRGQHEHEKTTAEARAALEDLMEALRLSDAERNRRVAEICGYEVNELLQVFEQLPNGNTRYLGSVREPERDDWGEVSDGLGCFDPLHNANQAIEALTKKFGERWTATHSERGTVIAATTEDRRACVGVVKDPDPVRAFCQAAVAAIEAAGGKG